MSIDMNPARVRRAGDDLTQMAETAGSRTNHLLHSSDDAAAGNPGWRSAQALREVRHAWGQHVDKLVANTKDAAQALRDSADRVVASDQEGKDRLLAVLHDMAGEQPR